MKLAWGNAVSPEFRSSVLNICHKFDWTADHASWLMACIAFETGGTFDPAQKNLAGSSGTGLIQFMRSTAIGLGTTVEELAEMAAVQQLEYVRLYFMPYAARIKTLSDMYMAILAPSAVGKPEGTTLYSGSDGGSYRMNAPLDINNDGKITKQEATRFVASQLQKGLAYGNWREVDWGTTKADAKLLIAKIRSDLNELEKVIGEV